MVSSKNVFIDIITFIITFYICGILWVVLGSIGYNRLGWFGVGIAGFPPVILGAILFYILQGLFKNIYSD